jgi:hypothetical protein
MSYNTRLRYVDISAHLFGKDVAGNTVILPMATEQTIVGILIPTSTEGRSTLIVAGNRFPMVSNVSFIDQTAEEQEAKALDDVDHHV